VTMVIAVCGKGGVGKTTFTALLIQALREQNNGPVLAVDADPNANLAPALGIVPPSTVGQVLEEFHGQKLTIPPGMSKASYLELRINQAIAETRGLDLLVMGRPEGPGCYCSANSILRDTLERLADNYRYVVIDNEAGMEHLSRRTASRIDVLLMVSDPSMKGVRTVGTLLDLVAELQLPVVKKWLIVSRAQALDPRLHDAIAALPVPLLGLIPEDPIVTEFDLASSSFLDLPDASPARAAVAAILATIESQWKT
jgi:CO dehydrogenase maturation factor